MLHQAFTHEARLYSVEQIREIEALGLAHQSEATLMQIAGLAAAELAIKIGASKQVPILILAGPGNNGGDAYEAGYQLARQGYKVACIMCGKIEKYSQDAQAALQRAKDTGLEFIEPGALINDTSATSRDWSLVIDGLFGIGLKRTPESEIARLIELINNLAVEQAIPVLAIDVPSGLNADTGQPVSPNSAVIKATHTITFIANKTGLHTGSGKDYTGKVTVNQLDIPEDFFPKCRSHLNECTSLLRALTPRKQNSHKGSFGDVVILGGAMGMAGAAILAARAAQYSGAGRTYCSMLAEAPAYDSLHPEIMFRKLGEESLTGATVVIGPGLGTSASAYALLVSAIQTAQALVIDADALNLIAADTKLQALLFSRNTPCILTPHPLEAARLLNKNVADIQNNRPQAAHALAQQFNAVIILKGSGSIICNPDGSLLVNTTGNPALASGGTGDVLAGVAGALLAQACNSMDAARIAAWVHGHAADELVARGTGPIGLTASELLPEIRSSINQLAYQAITSN
ncbi:NAD(P)H-hydrate dehydratase [Undibacterium sp. Ji83W]|uniref:NAD(P)H-hydrate dehydratase n=1 Tax=Undibacterium sp. Ji83W TaxID=3413043 RepID=UPI003BF1AFC6